MVSTGDRDVALFFEALILVVEDGGEEFLDQCRGGLVITCGADNFVGRKDQWVGAFAVGLEESVRVDDHVVALAGESKVIQGNAHGFGVELNWPVTEVKVGDAQLLLRSKTGLDISDATVDGGDLSSDAVGTVSTLANLSRELLALGVPILWSCSS